MSERAIRVLVVDDSAIVRRVLSERLNAEPDIEVVGTAPDPFVARDKLLALKPDVLTLDVEMPRMDGLSFLRRVMHFHPLPVIVISSIATPGCAPALEALRLGAVEVIAKPGGPYSVEDLGVHLVRAVRAAAASRVKARRQLEDAGAPPEPHPPHPPLVTNYQTDKQALVVIGASTGGVEAIREILTRLPPNMPPILIVQHIPPLFSRSLAEHLNRLCSLEVAEAVQAEPLISGRVLIAPGNRHMQLGTVQGKRCVLLNEAPPVNHHRPCIDTLFHSVARMGAKHCVAALLTGMGSDGAEGLLELRKAGAATIAQDESTSTVYGMPAEAVRLGAARVSLPLDEIACSIVRSLTALAAATSKTHTNDSELIGR